MQIDTCTHKEADTRLIRHLLHWAHAGFDQDMQQKHSNDT